MIKKKNVIPKGAIKIHLYHFKNGLRPRGTMQKESISLVIYERLISAFEDWSKPEYGDNPNSSELLKLLKNNLTEEIDAAWKKFIDERR